MEQSEAAAEYWPCQLEKGERAAPRRTADRRPQWAALMGLQTMSAAVANF